MSYQPTYQECLDLAHASCNKACTIPRGWVLRQWLVWAIFFFIIRPFGWIFLRMYASYLHDNPEVYHETLRNLRTLALLEEELKTKAAKLKRLKAENKALKQLRELLQSQVDED